MYASNIKFKSFNFQNPPTPINEYDLDKIFLYEIAPQIFKTSDGFYYFMKEKQKQFIYPSSNEKKEFLDQLKEFYLQVRKNKYESKYGMETSIIYSQSLSYIFKIKEKLNEILFDKFIIVDNNIVKVNNIEVSFENPYEYTVNNAYQRNITDYDPCFDTEDEARLFLNALNSEGK